MPAAPVFFCHAGHGAPYSTGSLHRPNRTPLVCQACARILSSSVLRLYFTSGIDPKPERKDPGILPFFVAGSLVNLSQHRRGLEALH